MFIVSHSKIFQVFLACADSRRAAAVSSTSRVEKINQIGTRPGKR